jgi:hypothetical protein
MGLRRLGVGATLYTDNIERTKMTMVNYFPLVDGIDPLYGEVVFSSDEWTHLMVDGTDTIAVVPSVDVYPA